MARPGFVLEVDDRTPPLVVRSGDGFRLERFPVNTRVVYPAESLPALPDVGESVTAALDEPVGSEPLAARLHAGMKLVVAYDDISTPLPRMRRPDIRGRILEAVLSQAARAGVDDVTLVAARGLSRRMSDEELQHVVGERVFRSFFADGRLISHDAEDVDQLTVVGTTEAGDTALNAAAVAADLLVFVHVAAAAGNGVRAVALGLGSSATVSRLSAQPDTGRPVPEAGQIEDQVAAACSIFQIEAVLDNSAYASPLSFLGRREWEWNVKDQTAWLGVHRGLSVTSAKTRRRILAAAPSSYAPIQITAGAPAAVAEASEAAVLGQRLVEINGQADVAIVGVGNTTPGSVASVTNPVLAAWSALASAFTAHRGRPVVRAGGALIVYHPMRPDFSPLHHPSSVDFFAEVLPVTTDPVQIAEKFEAKFATDPWYAHLYRSGHAFHGVHPFLLWNELAAARAHCGDVIFVGAHRPTVDRLGFRAASTLADALEIVSSTVGRTPAITYLHTPDLIVTDVR
jgi:hypothetical protein